MASSTEVERAATSIVVRRRGLLCDVLRLPCARASLGRTLKSRSSRAMLRRSPRLQACVGENETTSPFLKRGMGDFERATLEKAKKKKLERKTPLLPTRCQFE